MRYQISWEILHGVPNILGNFAWGTKYPRKFSVQDAVFPGLEGGSKFSGGIPFSLGKIVRRCHISWGDVPPSSRPVTGFGNTPPTSAFPIHTAYPWSRKPAVD